MIRDAPRNQLPPDACWDLLDFIPSELGAPLAKRGGWGYLSAAFTTIHAAADYMAAVAEVPFAAGTQRIAISYDTGAATARLGQIISSSSTTDRGAAVLPEERPTFYRNLLVITGSNGTTTPQTYNGTASATNLTVAPPTGSRSAVYKDRLVLARTTAQPQRVYFSGPGDITAWDTAIRYIDSSGEVRALWPLRNQLLVFHRSTLERIIGAIPPPGSDMSVQPISDVGLMDARSLAGTDEFVAFANASGVYLTDGATTIDVTEQGGMKRYWAERMATVGTHTLAGGYGRGYYFVTIANGSTRALVDTFMIHLRSRRFFRLSNVNASMYARQVSGDLQEDIFFSPNTAVRVGQLSSIFTPSATFKADADGVAVLPAFETGYFSGSLGRENWRTVWTSYDLRDAASDNPILTSSYITSPEGTSFTNFLDSTGAAHTLTETNQYTRVKRLPRNGLEHGYALKYAQTGASANTFIYGLEAEVTAIDGTSL